MQILLATRLPSPRTISSIDDLPSGKTVKVRAMQISGPGNSVRRILAGRSRMLISR